MCMSLFLFAHIKYYILINKFYFYVLMMFFIMGLNDNGLQTLELSLSQLSLEVVD